MNVGIHMYVVVALQKNAFLQVVQSAKSIVVKVSNVNMSVLECYSFSS